MGLRGRLVTCSPATTSNAIWLKKKNCFFDGRTHQNISRTACLRQATSCREKSRTVEHGSTVEPCSTVTLFTLVNSFFFFNEKHGEKFSFFLKKKVQLIDFTRIIYVNMNNIIFLKN